MPNRYAIAALMALLIVTACGVPALSPVSTPSPSAPQQAQSPQPNSTLPAQPDVTPQMPPDLAMAGEINRDITYCTERRVALKLDMYVPRQAGDKPLPVAVYVHGGGWTGGDKAGGDGIQDMAELLRRGYLIVSVNYRLAPQFKFPAQIHDVKCAIRFLRASAAIYHLDPNHIGVWGSSTGAHLAALLGTTDASSGFEGSGGYADQSSRVQAVVDMFGPVDLAREFAGASQRVVSSVFGASSNEDPLLVRFSPLTYVSADDPPFLIIQGEQDQLVLPSQSQEFYDRLKAAGVSANLLMVKNAGHSLVPRGGPIQPTRPEISKAIADFFDKYLR